MENKDFDQDKSRAEALRGGKGAQFPGCRIAMGGRRITAGDAEKS